VTWFRWLAYLVPSCLGVSVPMSGDRRPGPMSFTNSIQSESSPRAWDGRVSLASELKSLVYGTESCQRIHPKSHNLQCHTRLRHSSTPGT